MQRFCCFPLNETPDITVRMNCISTCCASDTKAQDDNTNDKSLELVRKERKRSCCSTKKRKTSKTQANVDASIE